MTMRRPMGRDRWQRGWRKQRALDGASATVCDAEGRIVEVEHYETTGECCGREPLVRVRIETPTGELIAREVPRRVSDTAYDVHVVDAQGTLRLILHHLDVGRGEPFALGEEWVDR
ncbi:MAG: hypothetical protein AB1505_27065 [Candidatus Latescibacterota bacterium]